MAWSRAQQLLALDSGHAAAARVTGSGASRRLSSLAVMPLPAGVIAPSVTGPNVLDRPRALDAVRGALDRIGRAGDVVLLLPQSAARTAIVDVPPGADPEEHGRFRISARLPYAASEARVQVVPLGEGRYLVAALRASVADAYDSLAREAGVDVERVDLAHLAALASPPLPRAAVDVVLGDDCVSFAAWSAGALRVFRTRLRDDTEQEAEWLYAEALRTALLAGPGEPRVRVVGRGAGLLLEHLAERGRPVDAGFTLASDVDGPSPVELAWLGAALA